LLLGEENKPNSVTFQIFFFFLCEKKTNKTIYFYEN
jgi:hypothetical protein